MYNIDQDSKLKTDDLEPLSTIEEDPSTDVKVDERYLIFGNLPIDQTSTMEDDQLMLEHMIDTDGDNYISVPAKNILVEFFLQSTVGHED